MTTVSVQQATRAEDFVQSIGVNTHLMATTSSYGNINSVISQLHYLGVDHVRDETPDTSHVAAYASVGASGAKLDLIVMGNLPQSMASIDALAPYVNLVEGPNEVNVTVVRYNGLIGTTAAIALQKDLYSAVHQDANLNGSGRITPVLNFTVAIGGSYTRYGNMAAYADYTNVHAYAQYGVPPHWFLQNEINGTTDTPGRPVIVTETGNYTMPNHDSGVSEDVQAKLLLATLLDDFKSGVKSTYLYQLQDGFADPNSSNPELHYGLFHADGTAKIAATAIHNLTSILADTGATTQSFATAPLSFAVTGMPSYGNQYLMEKSNGAYDLTLWQEPAIWNKTTNTETTYAPITITVTLGQIYKTINVYDPMVGTGATQTFHNVSTVQVALGTGPLVIEVEPNSSAAQNINTGAAGGVFASTGADTIVAGSGAATVNASGAATITGSTGALTVALTGSNASVTGGAGALIVTSTSGANTVAGGSGAFTYTDMAGGDLITTGTSGNNQVTLGSGSDTVSVLGATTLTGGAGAAIVKLAGTGSSVTGGAGALTLTDAIGGNTITGGAGVNSIILGSGADTVTARGVTTIVDNRANVTVIGQGNVSINGGMGSLTLTGSLGDEYVFTQAGTHNLLNLSSGKNSVLGHGADTINASTASGASSTYVYAAGPDLITGGAGTLSVNGQGSAITVQGGTGAVKASTFGNGSYLKGGSLGGNVLSAAGGNTTLVGGGSGDTLTDTGSGNNLLVASAGTTTLTAGSGNDTLVGGAGADMFVFTHASTAHAEVVQNFKVGTDHVSFAGFGATTPIASQQVVGGNLQLTLADQTQVTFLSVTSLS